MDFVARHIGPREKDVTEMLALLGAETLDQFSDKVIPDDIRIPEKAQQKLKRAALSESEALERISRMARRNQLWRSYIGLGFYGTHTPSVIQRNILENPGWYTQYTPYQAEISQGRLEALLNFQTMICDLTGLAVANASLLDEASAAAEALMLCLSRAREGARSFFISESCHPQTIAVVKTRANLLGVEILVGDHRTFTMTPEVFGALVQYPATSGEIYDYKNFAEAVHQNGGLLAAATDLLALTLLAPPGEWGADMALGSSQRFGVPLFYGGPHAAFFAVKDELKRVMPGRLIGVSKDASGRPGLRLSLQTREQHIRREKATSNICTAQVLLAIMASMYGVFHGPDEIKRIAERVRNYAYRFASILKIAGFVLSSEPFFDTLRFEVVDDILENIKKRAALKKINLYYSRSYVQVAFDETVTEKDFADLVEVVTGKKEYAETASGTVDWPEAYVRHSPFMQHKVFNSCHSETEFLRYVTQLQARDLSLANSMIPLGSCTMKLNATSEMVPVSWKEFTDVHPFCPGDQVRGYSQLFKELCEQLRAVTGFGAVSFQPNSGAAGEYTGLAVIRSYLQAKGQGDRDICLIPHSAHGTNPASAAMAGLKVMEVACDEAGNIDVLDLSRKANENASRLAAIMVTYPSTHGVFEADIKKICKVVHDAGGQVYMDGANLNAMVGLCRPFDLGADLCHINLHKTFCIPHGGGGPGAGPIAVKNHLAPFLPNHPLIDLGYEQGLPAVAAGPFGSAAILGIPFVYISCMGSEGLKKASQMALLNANYIAKKLDSYYPVLYRGKGGFVAHECILDLREIEKRSGIKVEDVAKRLMDYGFHAPTISWPVPGTMMVEPTESESKAELDRFCEAMIAIREEIRAVEEGRADKNDNVLKNAPHTALTVTSDSWSHPYSREQAAFPTEWTKKYKFWPAIGRIDAAYGDRNLICSCY